jgi:hypothetical protein
LPQNPVETHYSRQDLGEIILAALKQAGKDIEHLTPDDLAPVDEFHGGQRQATIRLADLLGPGGEPHYPVPWAREASISFLLTAEATRAKLEAAGFRVVTWQDTTSTSSRSWTQAVEGPPPPLGIHLLVGPDWAAIARNSARNYQEDRVRLFNAVLERPN